MHLKILSAKWQPFCLSLNVLSATTAIMRQSYKNPREPLISPAITANDPFNRNCEQGPILPPISGIHLSQKFLHDPCEQILTDIYDDSTASKMNAMSSNFIPDFHIVSETVPGAISISRCHLTSTGIPIVWCPQRDFLSCSDVIFILKQYTIGAVSTLRQSYWYSISYYKEKIVSQLPYLYNGEIPIPGKRSLYWNSTQVLLWCSLPMCRKDGLMTVFPPQWKFPHREDKYTGTCTKWPLSCGLSRQVVFILNPTPPATFPQQITQILVTP